MTLADLLQYLIAGVTVGSVYAITAVGFNLIFNATTIVNFAQGEFVMLGGMVAIALAAQGVPAPLAFPASTVAVALVGFLVERWAVRPKRKASVLTLIVITLAVAWIIKGVVMLVWGRDPHTLASFSGDRPIKFLGASVSPQALWVIGLTCGLGLLLWLFFERTLTGKAMRACAENRTAARAMGINADRMVGLSFILSAAIGAIAGITLAPLILMDFNRGTMLGLKGFAAAVIGGLGNNTGALLGGLLLGILESTGASVASSLKDGLAFVVLLLVLFCRPAGLLGQWRVRKV